MIGSASSESHELMYLRKLADYELMCLYFLGPGSDGNLIQDTSRDFIISSLLTFIELNNVGKDWCENSLKEALSFNEINEIIGADGSIRFICFKYKPFSLFFPLNLEQLAYVSINNTANSKQEKVSYLRQILNEHRKLKKPADLEFITNDSDLTLWALNYITKYYQTRDLNQSKPLLNNWHSRITDIYQVEAKILIDTLISQIVSINTIHLNNCVYSFEDKQRLYELERRDLVLKLKSAYTRRKSRTNKDKETKEFSFTMNKSIEKKLSELSAHEGKTKSAIVEELLTKAYRTMKKKPSVLGED
ncbi:hypothetical protein C1E24_08225 [Pseudoalteromonas phenolica]|uniref:Uncharacterized protein n=1 Tax=Pseudoalteromonas phenolica TaxID=161398 RepID=A0A5R9Q4P4_9GAMM|nr:hypothetical protein [Pseudoalteromonas phenolica]TLX47337.1 hypothetical protein C1E24_08225 [Pseudoalteromonas phenolica]